MSYLDYLKNIYTSWSDIKYGYDLGYMNLDEIIEFAKYKTQINIDDSLIYELSITKKANFYDIQEMIEKLIKEENINTLKSKEKWLYIILKELYENKENIADPLGKVEEVYADFDYPEEMESFVRYMPISEEYKDVDNKEECIKYLYKNWYTYLDKYKNRINS